MSHSCKHAQHLLTLIALGAACIAGSPAHAQYNYADIDVPGATGTCATGINDAGQIVGDYSDANFNWHGFVDTNGVFTTVDVPGSVVDTYPTGINASGQIVGEYRDTNGNLHGYLDTGGAFSILDYPNAPLGDFLNGINDAGQIVGYYRASKISAGQYISHGFIYSSGVFTILDAQNATFDTFLNGINSSGQIVGSYDVNDPTYGYTNGSHGFLDTAGVFTLVDVPDGSYTSAVGISNNGQIIGHYTDINDQGHGFVKTDEVYTIIDAPNARIGIGFPGTIPTGINNAGQIVGYYDDANYNNHGFLATPLPRPTALTATVSGSAVVLKWQAATGSVLRYDVYRGTTPGGETLYQSAGTATTATDSVLTPGTSYFYTAKAVSSLGTSFPSNEVTATVPVVPAAPTNLQAAAGNMQVTLSWTAPTGSVTSYTLYRGTSAANLTVLKTGITATTFTNVSLKNGTTYYYAVAAVNSAGTGARSSTASATPSALPAAPTNLHAVPGNTQVTLSWTASAGPVTSYTLYRGTSAASLTVLKTGITATTFTNVSLKHGTTYYYTVHAVNSAGTGPASNEVSATP